MLVSLRCFLFFVIISVFFFLSFCLWDRSRRRSRKRKRKKNEKLLFLFCNFNSLTLVAVAVEFGVPSSAMRIYYFGSCRHTTTTTFALTSNFPLHFSFTMALFYPISRCCCCRRKDLYAGKVRWTLDLWPFFFFPWSFSSLLFWSRLFPLLCFFSPLHFSHAFFFF